MCHGHESVFYKPRFKKGSSLLFLPPGMAHIESVECFFLNKSTSYRSLCLSLSSFHGKISRTRVSLIPETGCSLN